MGSGCCLQNIQLLLRRGMVREPGGVIFLSSGPDCRRCGLFIAACTQLARQGPGCGCCQRWGALQMLSGNLRWTILQRFASSQNLHIQQFLLPGLSWHREWETQINWNYKWVLVFAVECIIVLPMCAAYQQRCVSQMFTCASLRGACRTTGSH